MRTAMRSWRLTWKITRLNLRVQLEYRAELLMMIAVGLTWQGSVVVFATVMLTHFPGMGGWSSRDVLLMTSMRLLTHALYMVLMGPIGWATVDGYLDAYLLRPMSVYRQIRLSFLGANVFADLAVALSLFGIAVGIADVDWSPARIGYLIVALAGGTAMEAAIKTVISAAAMHTPAAVHWGNWVDELMNTFGNYPLHILPSLARDLLVFVLPLGFIAYLPVAVLTGRLDTLAVPAPVAVAAPLIGLTAFLGARQVWNMALRRYKGYGAA